MKVGHGSARYRVPEGSPLGGYLAENRTADDAGLLEINVVLLRTERESIAQVVIDAICVNLDMVEAITAELATLGISQTQVSATHSHSAPEWGCFPGGAATPQGWIAPVTDATVAAARAALGASGTATADTRRITVAGVATIRNVDLADYDVPVDVISFRDEHANLVGVWANVPIHSTVLPAGSRLVSGDLIGDVRAALRDELGVWALVSVGAAGDVSTRGRRREATPRESARLGRMLATRIAEAARAAAQGHPFDLDSVTTVTITLPGKKAPHSGGAGAVDRDDTSEFAARRRATVRQAYEMARMFPPLHDYATRVTVLDCGDTIVVGVPVEPLSRVANELESAVRATGRHAQVVMVGYSGGYLGYLPSAQDAERETYEAIISPFSSGAASMLVDGVVHAIASGEPAP